MDSQFERAVGWAHVYKSHAEDLHGRNASLADAVVHYLAQDAGGRAERMTALIATAETKKFAWDTLSRLAQHVLRAGEPVPVELATWVADVLAGQRKRPAKDGDPRGGRDAAMLACLDRLIHGHGLAPTRNQASPPESACDAVASAWSLSYKAVERVYLHGRQTLLDNVLHFPEKV